MRWIGTVLVVAAVACGKGEEPKAKPAEAPAPAPAAAPAPAPTPSKLQAARCGEPCLFLVDTPLTGVDDALNAKCPGAKPLYLDCKHLDYARNCVFAAHGLKYKKTRWQKAFTGKPWYEPGADTDPKKITLSDVERANVHELYSRAKACKKNLDISGADYDKLKAWIGALPKPPLPAIAMHALSDDQLMDPEDMKWEAGGKELLAWLEQVAPNLKAKVKAGKNMYGHYETDADLARQKQLVAALGDVSKLRSIVMDVELAHGTEEAPFDEGVVIRFVLDGDKIVAVTAEHYAMD